MNGGLQDEELLLEPATNNVEIKKFQENNSAEISSFEYLSLK